jgi:hypothetical protein
MFEIYLQKYIPSCEEDIPKIPPWQALVFYRREIRVTRFLASQYSQFLTIRLIASVCIYCNYLRVETCEPEYSDCLQSMAE